MNERRSPALGVAIGSRRHNYCHLDWCSYEAARYACEHWHYSKTIPRNKSNTIGVWEAERFIGAVIFGLGATPSLGKPYGLGIFDVCELTRVALREHVWPVSRILKIATIMVSRKNPKTRLIVSFADPFRGHHGGIYQAGGWIYSGVSQGSMIWRLKDGSFVDPRRYDGHGHNKPRPVPIGAMLVTTPGKHRYLLPLDAEMRERIAPLAKPYPKRVKQATDGHHPSSGGAAPTHTLQT